MTPDEIYAEMDFICLAAQVRRFKASDTMRGLLPSDVDWMEQAERVRFEELRLMLPRDSRDAARARVAVKRAARLKGITR